ncbi:MAG: transcriptional regulator/antitoxin, MazE [Verrucomicrobia bacterium]|nr:transcriptional regulator/antitoxin, MazE [Verrucomicrobiota bacterium]
MSRVMILLSKNGQIELPVEIRRQDGILPGQEFEFERLDCGEYRLKRLARRHNKGLVKLLLACPVKGWFQPSPRTETTDDIKIPVFK